MKVVQIGISGHAFYAYEGIKKRGFDFAAIAPGSYGIEAEGTESARNSLIYIGFSPKLYADWREMLEQEKPDIAIVNPWFNENGSIALYALERGIHVFCEKPLASDFDSLSMLYDITVFGTAILAAMLESRYMSGFVTVKNAILDGRIGKVRLMDSRKSYKLGKRPSFYSSRETYCGILPWVAIHAIDWMSWLSGEKYLDCSARNSTLENGGNGDMDITSSAQFLMTNDVIATLTADMYRPGSAKTHGDDRVRVVGTEGILELRDGIVTLISDREGGEIILENAPSGDIFADFLDQIEGKSNDLTAKSAIESTYWSLIADRSARSNSEIQPENLDISELLRRRV